MRRDFVAVTPPTELIAKLSLLLSHRNDLIEDRVRTVQRLRHLRGAVCSVL